MDGNTDAGYVDHKEEKLQSPERDHFSPSMGEVKTGFHFPVQNGQEDGDHGDSMSAKDVTGVPSLNGSKDISLDDQSGTDVERFTERQENKVVVDEPEGIAPSNIVDKLFQFVDDETDEKGDGITLEQTTDYNRDVVETVTELELNTAQSASNSFDDISMDVAMVTPTLDDVNNNTEQVYNTDSAEVENTSSKMIAQFPDLEVPQKITSENVPDFSLTAEEEKTKFVEESVELVHDATSDSANVNLYWYSPTTIELDPLEIEQVKNGTSADVIPEMQIRMLSDVVEEINTPETEDGAKPEAENITLQMSLSREDKWSTAFDSASSRFLDLASEMKSKSEEKLNSQKEVNVEVGSKIDPWGLESENYVSTEMVSEAKEGLPDLDSAPLSGDVPVMQMEVIVPESSDTFETSAPNDLQQTLDKTDTEISLKLSEMTLDDVTPELNSNLSAQEVVRSQYKSLSDEGDDENEDEADAVGMMLLSDRPADSRQENMVSVESEHHNVSEKEEEKIVEISEQIVTEAVQQAEVICSGERGSHEQGSKDEVEGLLQPELDEKEVRVEEIMQESADVVQLQMTFQGQTPVQLNEKLTIGQALEDKPKMGRDPFQVKRKYTLNTDSETRLMKLGGTLQAEDTFTDIYYDNDCYTLTLNNSWLRQRNGSWEMKESSPYSSTSCYLDSEDDIQNSLLAVCGDSNKLGEGMTELLDSLDIVEFASFLTTRKTFILNGVTVVMDLTDFGFQVGQLEVTAENLYGVPSALSTMENLASQLGLQPLQAS